ncbi:MAG: hypothetical protein CM1200mP30_29760 [Pseudomonadota bacterium]|nr:MAG: hypothetical protein CM1200mP30_29760 [Pseudomonadota bacterium]
MFWRDFTQDGVINGSIAEKSERIIKEGRTFSYILHDGEQKSQTLKMM